MLELADIFRAYGPVYRQKYGDRMLPSHHQALWDIENCRTNAMGGEVYWCDQCTDYLYSYHSCGNRHCPKCESDRADRWRDRQLDKLLPVPYFLLTFTLPHTLNPFARSHQKLLYALLFTTSADALHTLACNPKWLGGQIGMVGELHTWDRHMGYHVHVHSLVPAGGLDPQTGTWTPSHPNFLVSGAALRAVFRAKFRDALKAAAPNLFTQVPPATWTTTWVVHCQPVGDGRTALKYLAPYIYRVALSNQRLVSMKDDKITFRYKPRQQPWNTMTLDALAFIQRFLQHVLPKGFHKVRTFGFPHPSARQRFQTLKEQLETTAPESTRTLDSYQTTVTDTPSPTSQTPDAPGVCPHCGNPLHYFGHLPRSSRGPP